ncbi:hypothetical protein KKI24_23890 [bacterium]|nr:hypothetical protein [bacterium]
MRLKKSSDFEYDNDMSLDEYLEEEGVWGVAALAVKALDLKSAFMLSVTTFGFAVGGGFCAIVNYQPENAND